MSPGRASRLCGLVFALLVVLGGLGAAGADDDATASGDGATVQVHLLIIEWD